jgi:MFS superfamily sulfate permease-like transporter
MIGVLAFGLLEGLIIAALLGLLVLLIGTKQRSTHVLGKESATNVYRSLSNYPQGETYPGLLIIGFDGALYFANVHDFVNASRRAIAKTEPQPKVVLVDGESVNGIDATAVITLREFQGQLAQSGIQLRFARIKTHVMGVMERAGLKESVPAEYFYPSVQSAVDAYLAEQQAIN